MEKGQKSIEIPLPEEVIQHIQSFMSGKEAARSTVLSKSWYAAWLTRPTIDLDELDFLNRWSMCSFKEFAKKTMQRYLDSNLKIKSFRLRILFNSFFNELISYAMKVGATDVEIENPLTPFYTSSPFSLKDVLGSETLLRLSLIGYHFVGNHLTSCSRLKSLNLKYVTVYNDQFNDIISCLVSLEELSMSNCPVKLQKLFGHHKLRRLFLKGANFDSLFFTDFDTRFPCLKDLTLTDHQLETISIASNSLETISFKPYSGSYEAAFDVPNIQKFTYYGVPNIQSFTHFVLCLPPLSINGASREWEFDITIDCDPLDSTTPWLLELKKLFSDFRSSRRISHSISIDAGSLRLEDEEGGVEVEAEPLEVENLRIKSASSSLSCYLMVRLLGKRRPNFITHFLFNVGIDMKKLGKIETTLPEAMIQHIQSFMSRKEAARTTILSKSWYNAWLTGPTMVLDYRGFSNHSQPFEEFVKKTMQRYLDLSLNIERFRLSSRVYLKSYITHNLIVSAMKIGATDVKLELSHSFDLPQELFGSETLLKLSLTWCKIDGNYFIRCSRLKSLTLKHVLFTCDFKDLTTSCVSLEELSVSCCSHLEISRVNLNELHKLRRLYLEYMIIDSSFFSDLASRFPCLKDLTIHDCRCTIIYIASTSLETISYKPSRVSYMVKFDVPNIRKFTCSSRGLPSEVSVDGALQEWEFDASISIEPVPEKTWFSNLKRLVENQFKRSRIVSLSIHFLLPECRQKFSPEPEMVDVEKAESKPLVVDNLRIIDTPWSCFLLVRLFGIFRPKMITHCLHSDSSNTYDSVEAFAKQKYFEKEALDMLCQKLTRQVISPNCGVPDQDMFGKFGPKRVNVEVMDKFGNEWWPLALEEPLDVATIPVVNKRKVRFHLIWD